MSEFALAVALALLSGSKWEAVSGPHAEKAAAVRLTQPGELGWYGGAEVAAVHARLRDEPGWTQGLTPAEFTGLLILHEASLLGPPAEDLIAEVVARHLWAGGLGGNPPYCTAEPCLNGAFNFWARYSESAHRLVDAYRHDAAGYIGPNVRAQLGDAATLRRAAQLGALALSPPLAWRRPDNDAPFHWGNAVWHGPAVYRAGSFVVFTPNQGACNRIECWN